MDILNLNEIKDIILIISGIGTFVSAFVVMFTVLEIKKQRLSSYKPEIILDSFVSFFYADNFLTEDEKFNLYAVNMFFVEVCYNSLENKISGIKSFKSGHLLDKYSNIDGLF
jgi:hypothetical protein